MKSFFKVERMLDVTLLLGCGIIAGAVGERVTVSTEWQPLDTHELYIKSGSALDLTGIVGREPAGIKGRVIVNDRGQLAFAQESEKEVRFFSLQMMPLFRLNDISHAEMTELAAAIARQGYNMVRLHFLDSFLLNSPNGANLKNVPRYRLPERAEEIKFDPERLDDFFFFIAELKKNGIYINLDLMSSYVGYDNGKLGGVNKTGDYNTKIQMFVNPMFRQNWRAGVTKLLNTVNPYTGVTLKEEPAVGLAVCLNEQEILLGFRDYSQAFKTPWHEWLKRKYGDYKSLYRAWKGRCGKVTLAESNDFEQVPGINEEAMASTPAGCDMSRFCGDMETEMSRFYCDTLQEIGYTGLVSNWNMRTRLCTVPARAQFPLLVMNCYHAHPSYGDDKPFVSQNSALGNGGSSFNSQAVARFLDRPFFNTEFGLVFWNPYRHEQGLLYGAGAAFQGWSGLTCHADQVTARGNVLRWFDTGKDPVIRAAELVTAFAFLRCDVKPSPHTIEIPVNDGFIFNGRGMRTVSDELSRLWTICRVGITYGPKKWEYPTALTIHPEQTSGVGGGVMFTTVEKASSVTQLEAIIRQLRQDKVLSDANLTAPKNGIFQSDTGELLLNTATGGEFQVVTPRLEGAVLKRDKVVKLNTMTITACSVPASITLISLDAKATLAKAARRLLVFSTDALNSNMTFTDATHNQLAELGSLPVLVRTGRLELNLAVDSSRKYHVFALKLNGERGDSIPVSWHNGSLVLKIDTGKLKTVGPTPFFEIVSE